MEGLRQQLTEVRNAETKRLQGITGAQRKIEDLKRALAVAPPQEASLETGQRSNELREQILRIKGEIMELSAQHDACSKAIDDANEEKKRATAQ